MNKKPTEQEKNPLTDEIKFENPEIANNQIIEESFDDNLSEDESENNDAYRTGRWHPSEHYRFIKGCLQYGNNWKKVKECVKTRSSAQIRSHAQKYIIKLCKKFNIQDNKQLKSFKNIKRKFPTDMMGDCEDAEFASLKNEDGDLTQLNMEQIEEMILGIFKSNNTVDKKISINLQNLKFKCPEIESPNCITEDKKNKVFETVKEPKTKIRKGKNSNLNPKVNNPSKVGINNYNDDPGQIWNTMNGINGSSNNMSNLNLQNLTNMGLVNNNYMLNDQMLYLLMGPAYAHNQNLVQSGQPNLNNFINNTDGLGNLLNYLPHILSGEPLSDDLVNSLLKSAIVKPEDVNFTSDGLNVDSNGNLNQFGNLNDPLSVLNSCPTLDPNNFNFFNDMLSSFIGTGNPTDWLGGANYNLNNNLNNGNNSSSNLKTASNFNNNFPGNSNNQNIQTSQHNPLINNFGINNFNENMMQQLLLGGNLNGVLNSNFASNQMIPNGNNNNISNAKDSLTQDPVTKFNYSAPDDTINRNLINEDQDYFEINNKQSLQQISDVLKIISNNPSAELSQDVFTPNIMGNYINNSGSTSDIIVKNEEKETNNLSNNFTGNVANNNIMNSNNSSNNFNNSLINNNNNESSHQNQARSNSSGAFNNSGSINNINCLNSLNPSKPNENILTDDLQISMLLSLLNQNGMGNVDVGHLITLMENQNTQMANAQNAYNNYKSNVNNINNFNSFINKKSNETLTASNNNLTSLNEQEKEESYVNKSGAQITNPNNIFQNNNQTTQDLGVFNQTIGGGLYNVGFMNQYLIGQNPSNRTVFNSKQGGSNESLNYPLNFNTLDLYNPNIDPSFINGNQNMNNNLK